MRVLDAISKYVHPTTLAYNYNYESYEATVDGILEHMDMFDVDAERVKSWKENPESDDELTRIVAEQVIIDLAESVQFLGLAPLFHPSNDWEKYLNPDGTCFRRRSHVDHTGTVHRTFISMCKAYRREPQVVRQNLMEGSTLAEVLTDNTFYGKGKLYYVDPDGKSFRNLTLMCRHHGTSVDLYNLRKMRGCTERECLEAIGV